ncbi:MAG: branched-chain amino acid ABC transporter ATP-binding protein/permease [Thermoleophilia bacterium]|nr:branched-chain amino acid ABC transporter ATP-binding protein/permease [Thermoleophilia bacterium]
MPTAGVDKGLPHRPARLWSSISDPWATGAKVLAILVLLVWPLILKSPYGMSVMATAGIYALQTVGVAIILGQAGQLSLGHSAFYGIGAYLSGLLASRLHLPTLLCLLIGTVVPGIVAYAIGKPVLKLRYFYLMLATIGLGQIFVVAVMRLGFTGGLIGFSGVPTLGIGSLRFDSLLSQYYLVWFFVLVVLLLLNRGLKYRLGRTLRALATSEIASSSLGIRTANWKLLAFVASAIICGLSGCLLGFVTNAVSPISFQFAASILPVIMMLVGGADSIWGAMIGAVIMTWLLNTLGAIQEYSGIAYPVIMILLLLFLPSGILGLRSSALRRVWEWSRSKVTKSSDRAAQEGVTGATPRDLDDCPENEAKSNNAGPDTFSQGTVTKTLLRIEEVTVTFGGLKALDRVSFEVAEGSITALIGPNGAGKTTLFNAITRHQALDSGRILLGDVDLGKLSPADAARQGMARTFQNLRIFENMSVLENVLVGCHRHEKSGFWSCCLGLPRQRAEERRSRETAMETLALLGLDKVAARPAASLPYGQRRLVEIARALASRPRLLLLDEPAAGMNAAERADLVRRIAAIRASGVTILLVEHDISLVMGISDRVNVLNYGQLIASGTAQEVQHNPRVVEAYLGTQEDQERTRVTIREERRTVQEDTLVVDNLVTLYGSIQALHGVSLTVPRGEVVAVLGANGAGKTTLLRTIQGLLRPNSGKIIYEGKDITSMSAEQIVARGICQVPEGRRLFPTLSVEDNLLMGASGKPDWRKGFTEDLAYVYDLLPVLYERRKQIARTLSGGEQQMVAIGRALMGHPRLLLLDEPSMGLAPLLVRSIYDALARLNEHGMTMLLVEQNAEMALSLAHRVVCMRTGSVVLSGRVDEVKDDPRLREVYLGKR